MKIKSTAIISIFCLSTGLFAAGMGMKSIAQHTSTDGPVASEYNPPGRGASYPGGTRFIEQPVLQDYA